MNRIPRKYGHVVYGILQSGLTCGVASAISTAGSAGIEQYLAQGLRSWSLSWLFMLPLVLIASPLIRRVSEKMTSSE